MFDDGIHYTWSMVDSYIRCPKLFYYQYIACIRPLKRSNALSAGAAIASALETYRSTKSVDAGAKALAEKAQEPDSNLVNWKIDDPIRSVERLLEIYYGYCENYPDEPEHILRSEIRFEYPVDKPFFFGRIDAIYQMQDGPAIIEDKTTSRLGDSFFLSKKDSFQVLWYMYIANALGLFSLGGSKKYMPKCLINAIYIHPTNLRYERDIAIKSPSVLSRAFDDLVSWIARIEEAKKSGSFPRNLNECHSYGGCPYLVLRDVTGSQYDRILEANFKREEKSDDQRDSQ